MTRRLHQSSDGASRIELVASVLATDRPRIKLPPGALPVLHAWKPPDRIDAAPWRLAAVRRALHLAERLSIAAQLLVDDTQAEEVHREQAELVAELWARALGTRDSTKVARHELLEVVDFAAKRSAPLEHLLRAFEFFWPDVAPRVDRVRLEGIVRTWRSALSRRARLPWVDVRDLFGEAGLGPPSATSIEQEWARRPMRSRRARRRGSAG